MRNVNKLLGTGCFFLCLGGWVCDGQQSRADSAIQAREAVLDAAVAQTIVQPGVTTQPAEDTAKGAGAGTAESAGGSPKTPPTEAVKTPPKTEAKAEGTNLNAAVVNVGVDGKVEQFNAQDLDINTALHFLSLHSHKNIIASKDVKGTVTVNLYNVTFTEALDALLKPNGFDYIEKGNFIYVYTSDELAKIKARDHKTVNRVFNLHYLNSQDAAVLIKPVLSSSAIVALTPNAIVGLPTGVNDTGGGNYATDDTLVISDYPENLVDVEKTLKQLDIRPKQVLVESTILNASLTDANALGVDIVSLSGVDFPNLLSVFGSDGKVGTPGDLAGKLIADGNSQHNVGTNFASAVPPGGLSIGFMNNHFSALVRALETVTNTTVVANPKILTLNKHHGEVLIGRKLGYITTTTSQTTTDQSVQFIDVGTKLVFRPFIGDNGYVRMEIHPEDSSGNIDSKGVPQKATTEVTSIKNKTPAAGQTEKKSPGKNLKIGVVKLTGTKVHVRGIMTMDLNLPDLELKDPTNPDGRPLKIADLVGQVVIALTKQILDNPAIPGNFKDAMKQADAIVAGVRGQLDKSLKEFPNLKDLKLPASMPDVKLPDAGKDIGKGINDLFNKKKN